MESQVSRSDLRQVDESRRLVERVRFHEPHLARVSRSFSYGISRLETPLRAAVGLAYLVCRLLDTIEDAPWASITEQQNSFKKFHRFLVSSPADMQSPTFKADVETWAAQFPADIAEGEKLLLADAGLVIAEFVNLEASEKSHLLQPVLSMSRGMSHYASFKDANGELRLRNLADANQYCFFVAGLVGELLTGLAVPALRPIGLNSIHFGLFLQKMNLLKDQFEDEKSKRFLVPNRDEMLASVYENACEAFAYLKALPVDRKDYRLFCAWALFLGLATLPLLQDARSADDAVKVPRLQALGLAAQVELAVSSNERLQALFETLMMKAWPMAPSVKQASNRASSEADKAAAVSLLSSLYTGSLDPRELADVLVP